MYDVILPSLAEGVDKAHVTYWFRSEGDDVKEGEDLVELVTDKATFKLPSPASGTLKEILAAEGTEVKVGQVLAKVQ
ncbi:MAG: hypothetical protein A2987_03235 [Omnitrophica bacterium RIFCSPLOWO2_01_FULL_45_10]|nr:MAG: hypothetical protein A2987_03235 [Omnitrophica bacterium RIFCSPLOWO2_01_FULL_45_10]